MQKFFFILKTAYRDSRKNRGKLFLFMSSIVMGIAALVAINSFNYNLVADIDNQAASLLGADISANGNKVMPESLTAMMDSIPGESSKQLEMLTMSYISKTNDSQLISLKAIEGGFPYYGKIKTQPEEAAIKFKQTKCAVVDKSMLLQYELNIGDTIKVGKTNFLIAGELLTPFGSSGLSSGFAPSVYIDHKYLEETALVNEGSLIEYSYYKKLNENFEIDDWRIKRERIFRTENYRLTTIEERKEDLNEAFDNLNSFLNLIALISLLLGCIGVASSVFIYVKTKIPSIAIFRCLGMDGTTSFLIYLVQILVIGTLSVILGAILGSAIQLLLPVVLSGILPFEVSTAISWKAIFQGISFGALISLLFASYPLVSVRRVSPLRTLRVSDETEGAKFDWLKLLIALLIILGIGFFLWSLMENLQAALIFGVGLILSFCLLFLVAKFIMWLVRNYLPKSWSFSFRQGLSNLYRPNNQTLTLLVSIGLGSAILSTLYIIQGLLLGNVAKMDAGNQPNIVLYGIEKSQKDSLAQITRDFDLPIIQQVPIVTMKLDEWKGRSKDSWLKDTVQRVERWAVNRETRVSYRDVLEENEELVEGILETRVISEEDSIFISLDANYAEALNVEMGDEMIWNVQGVRMQTFVGSLRKIDFANMNARFFIIFPKGVLEQAPQFQILITKSPDTKTTANYRSTVVKSFPNISVVDLASILESLNEILSKINYVIKFLAAFSILTGFIVLLSSLFLSKFQRVKESVLLRTLGANRKQILKINAIEYFLIGSLSAFTGIFIAIVSSYLITTQQLKLSYDLDWQSILGIFFLIVLTTVTIGLLNSREVLNKSPLEVLRNELN